MYAIAFPAIDPVAVEIGPLAIRWYALAYVVGILVGWRYMVILARRSPAGVAPRDIDDFVLWATLGIVLGGRLGYVLFYRPGDYLQDRARGDPVRLAAADSLDLAGRSDRCGRADRFVLRARCQFHQRRAVGPTDDGSLGCGLPRRGIGAPSPEPAL